MKKDLGEADSVLKDDSEGPTLQGLLQLLSSTSRTPSRLLTEMIQPYRILLSGLDHNPQFSLGRHKIISTSSQQEVAKKTTQTCPKDGL